MALKDYHYSPNIQLNSFPYQHGIPNVEIYQFTEKIDIRNNDTVFYGSISINAEPHVKYQ